MHWITFALTADDTPTKITTLAALTGKTKNIVRFVIYPESGNDAGANGPARIGASNASRTTSPPRGIPLLPGIVDATTGASCGGAMAPYSFDHLYITGKTGDTFTIGWALV